MPKIVDHAERRKEIASTVLDLIAERGVNAATIRAVAERSGWSTGVIGHYFEDRKDLLLGALRRAGELAGAKQLEINRLLIGRQALEAVLEEELPLDRRRLALTRIFVFFYAEAAADESTSAEVDMYLRRWRRQVAHAVRAAQELGDLDPSLDADIVAMDLVALTDGLSIQAIFNGELMARLRESSPIRMWINRLAPLASHALDEWITR